MVDRMDTVWVFGDQLNDRIASLEGARPETTRVLIVTSEGKLRSKVWHRQRVHLVLTAMRRFAIHLRAAGFEVDERHAPSLAEGLAAHRRDLRPDRILAMEPMSWDGLLLLERSDVEIVRSNQFLCHREDFAQWADGRGKGRLVMEDFYRWQRQRLGYLMDGGRPAGGAWNFDASNREPPPRDARSWPPTPRGRLDAVDRDVLSELEAFDTFGADPDGTWATSRKGALLRLRRFTTETLLRFGPHEDAMLADEWRLAHSALSHALNIGLLLPGEVCDAAEEAYRTGDAPIASVEGFVRQVLGWREYVWGIYWRSMPSYRTVNELGAHRPLPPAFTGAPTKMRCVGIAVEAVHDRAWTHHIQRLMVLGNLALLAGVEPAEMVDWMWRSFVDGAEWVMLPNLLGMSLHADGGVMATKPYAGGGAYINRMSDYCKGCAYDPKRRTGEDACPFTTLYWDFLARHRTRFAGNHRMAQAVHGLDRLSDLGAVRERATEVLSRLDAGTL
ncbi:MAG: cryptochrome/photolyase CryB [Acidimicrobiales bacterium]